MKVYLVESMIDNEYGGRRIEAVCASRESAEVYIEEHGGNHDVIFWTDEIFPYYIINEWLVKE